MSVWAYGCMRLVLNCGEMRGECVRCGYVGVSVYGSLRSNNYDDTIT